jgi:hypothetical protein
MNPLPVSLKPDRLYVELTSHEIVIEVVIGLPQKLFRDSSQSVGSLMSGGLRQSHAGTDTLLSVVRSGRVIDVS